ncbi:LysE family translocator [Thalassotalea ganghwensis]
MFTTEIFITYTLACLLLVISPGPDNILAISRGLTQGKLAATISASASGAGILFHVLAATLGLTLLIQTSPIAFYLVKFVGAAYLLWLGIKVLRSKQLISVTPSEKLPLKNIFLTGFLSAALNPKPGIFVLAFIPQFISPEANSVSVSMLLLGSWFALLTTCGFALMGVFSAKLSHWLIHQPKVAQHLNTGAGLTFISSGIAIALIKRKEVPLP